MYDYKNYEFYYVNIGVGEGGGEFALLGAGWGGDFIL